MDQRSRPPAAARPGPWRFRDAWPSAVQADGLMILRPLEPPPAAHAELLPAWNVIERVQRHSYDSCWMITQPSHAALAGDFAVKLIGAQVPPLDAALIRAI